MIITAGEVQLRSGRWRWELLGGERVRFIHYVMEGQPDNQMIRPLVSDAPVDDASAKRFASHPGTRVWVAPDGERWLIHDLSYLARWRRPGPRELLLISADGHANSIAVSDSLEVGQLTDGDIGELVARARRAAEEADAAAAGEGEAEIDAPTEPEV